MPIFPSYWSQSVRVWTCWFKQNELVKDTRKEERGKERCGWHAKNKQNKKNCNNVNSYARISTTQCPPTSILPLSHPTLPASEGGRHLSLSKGESILTLIWDLNRFARIMLPRWPGISLFVKILPNSKSVSCSSSPGRWRVCKGRQCMSKSVRDLVRACSLLGRV